MKNFVQHTLFPILAAMIWGTAFSAQSVCSRYIPPFAVNAFRGIIAFAVLAAACLILKIRPGDRKSVIRGSLICGITLYVASNFQQFGIGETSAGKSGFITALYIVLVPVFSIFFGKKTSLRVWIAVAVAVAGMYLLCVGEGVSFGYGDLALLICAVMFAAQIIAIDIYTAKVNPVVLSAGQFLVCGVLSLVSSLLFESVTPADFAPCIWQMLYVALFSSCVAYTLQMFAQKGGNATIVTLLLSLESVFAVLAGMILLGEKMIGREYLGCLLMVVAIVIAQLPDRFPGRGGNRTEPAR